MCVTVFSASSYKKDIGNKNDILNVLKKGDQIEHFILTPIHQLNGSDANFFKMQLLFDKSDSKICFLEIYVIIFKIFISKRWERIKLFVEKSKIL